MVISHGSGESELRKVQQSQFFFFALRHFKGLKSLFISHITTLPVDESQYLLHSCSHALNSKVFWQSFALPHEEMTSLRKKKKKRWELTCGYEATEVVGGN